MGSCVLAGFVFVMLKLLLDWPIIRTFYCPMPGILTLEVFMPMAETFFARRFAMFRDRFGTSWMLLHPKADMAG